MQLFVVVTVSFGLVEIENGKNLIAEENIQPFGRCAQVVAHGEPIQPR